MNSEPIGVFDSGVGGISVLREIARELPEEDLVYYADQAHCPYGARPPDEIRQLARNATQFLLDHRAKVVVVACNTASAAGLADLRATFGGLPIVGMEPAIKPAALHTKTGKVAVLATEGTLRGELFERTREKYARDIEVIEAVGYGWVEIVERGAMNSAEAERRVRRVVEPLMRAGVDTLVLGCTHYPFLMPMIRAIVGAEVEVIDPSAAVARQTARVLAERGLLKNTQNPRQTRGKIEWFTSGEAREFERVRALVWKP